MEATVNHPSVIQGAPLVSETHRPAPRKQFKVPIRLRFLVLLGLLVAGFLGVRWYLSSRLAANRIASRLEQLLGAAVQVDTVEIGWTESTLLCGVLVQEAGEERTGPPWLVVKGARADVAALDWFGWSDRPTRIELDGATIDLRFDQEGHLLTRFPQPRGNGNWPGLALTNSRILLQQQGRQFPLDLNGFQGEIHADDGSLNLTGSITDPAWGQWNLDGIFQPPTGQVYLHLKTPRLAVDRERLERLPFVSPKVWQQVRIDCGVTSVDLTLTFSLTAPGVQYCLEMEMEDTKLHVSSISLDAERASGRVVVENGQVALCGIKGRTAGGCISTTGTLDFRPNPERLTFAIEVENVSLKQLPSRWQLPPQVAGDLSGRVDLQVILNEDGVRTTSAGEGKVKNAQLAGVPFLLALPLEPYSDSEGKLRFRLRLPLFSGMQGGN